jgi:MFS family permease
MTNSRNKNYQDIFLSMVVGILLYSVVLGFFNDYTNILHTSSYSVTFLLAIVMQILTYLTFEVKNTAQTWFKQKEQTHKFGLIFTVWFILFTSKFIFLWVISFVFRQEVHISGFVGLLLIVAVLTVLQQLFELVYHKLAD